MRDVSIILLLLILRFSRWKTNNTTSRKQPKLSNFVDTKKNLFSFSFISWVKFISSMSLFFHGSKRRLQTSWERSRATNTFVYQLEVTNITTTLKKKRKKKNQNKMLFGWAYLYFIRKMHVQFSHEDANVGCMLRSKAKREMLETEKTQSNTYYYCTQE